MRRNCWSNRNVATHVDRNFSTIFYPVLDCVWNVIAHAQKPDFVFRRNGRVHLNWQGVSVQSTAGSRGVRISGSNAGYTMFRCSVKGTGYPLHSPVSPSLPLPCVTVCHYISTGLYTGTNLSHLWPTENFGPFNFQKYTTMVADSLFDAAGDKWVFGSDKVNIQHCIPSCRVWLPTTCV
jgi:hypothetical protein